MSTRLHWFLHDVSAPALHAAAGKCTLTGHPELTIEPPARND
jgi:hypothetical protein